jgi:predicted DNA-binding protein
MPTKLQRVNLSIERDIAEDLELLAKITQKTVTGLAKELIIDALDRREDLYMSKLANEVDQAGAKTLSHEEFWA